MSAIFFALISYIGWGTGDIFGTIVTRKIGGFSISVWSMLLSLLIFSLLIPSSLNDLQNLTPNIFLVNVILGLLLMASLVSYNVALKISNASLVAAISASFPALVVVFSMIFLKEPVTSSQALAILVILLGLALSTFDFSQFKSKNLSFDKGILLALMTLLIWGIYFTFIKIPVREIGWFWPNYISIAMTPTIFIFMKIRNIKLNKPSSKQVLTALVLAVLLLRGAELSYNLAIQRGLVAIVAPIAGSYATLFVVLAFLVFKDPIKRQQIAGIITTLIGIVLLSVFSV